jgi:hypothetical protein
MTSNRWRFPARLSPIALAFALFAFAGAAAAQTPNELAPAERAAGWRLLFDGASLGLVLGTAGSILLDRNGYVHYDDKGKVVQEVREAATADGLDFSGNDAHTVAHIRNFANAVRTGEALRSPVSDVAKSILFCHLGNIAQYTGRKLRTEPGSGRIVGDEEAMKYWQREYAPGWAPTV